MVHDNDDGKWRKDFINALVEEDNESIASGSAHVSGIGSRLPWLLFDPEGIRASLLSS